MSKITDFFLTGKITAEKVEENPTCKTQDLQQSCSLCSPPIIPQRKGDNILEKKQHSTCWQVSLARTQENIFESEVTGGKPFLRNIFINTVINIAFVQLGTHRA